MTPEPLRYAFAPDSMEEAAHILASAGGAYCFVCRRDPWPAELRYKNLYVCAPCAGLARQRELMNDVTEKEAASGLAAIDRAGEYLASIGKFDLRDLTDAELAQFNAHFIAGLADEMRRLTSESPPF